MTWRWKSRLAPLAAISLVLLLSSTARGAPPSPPLIGYTDHDEGQSELRVADSEGQNSQDVSSITQGVRSFAWSPDGNKLAFATSENLYVVNSDGSQQREIFTAPTIESFIWAPDSQQLAVETDRAEDSLYVVPLDQATIAGFEMMRKTTKQFAFSSGSGRIAFQAVDGIYVARVDGSGLHRVAKGVLYGWAPGPLILYQDARHIMAVKGGGGERSSLTIGRDPIWSPSGDKILYKNHKESRLWTMDPDGTNKQLIVGDQENDPRPTAEIGWSPDGSAVHLVQAERYFNDYGPDHCDFEVWLVELSDRSRVHLSDFDQYYCDEYVVPSWSPDSQRLLVQSGDWPAIVTRDGSESAVLPDLTRDARWQP
jgi:Tol biopolymer transport system component